MRIDKKEHHGEISLERVRQASFTPSDLTLSELHVCHGDMSQAALFMPYSELARQNLDPSLLKRRKALLCRILQDFTVQLRHIISSPYNNTMFRRLACAIIRIITLDFTIEEIDSPRRASGGLLVQLHHLPTWNIWNTDILRVRGVSIVICPHIVHAFSLAKADCAKLTPADAALLKTREV